MRTTNELSDFVVSYINNKDVEVKELRDKVLVKYRGRKWTFRLNESLQSLFRKIEFVRYEVKELAKLS